MLTVNSPLLLDELLGAVEGVDQPEGRLIHRRDPAGCDLLLGDDRDVRGQLAQAVENQRLGRLVGGGHRRGVGLGPDLDLTPVVLHQHHAGALGEGDDRIEELGRSVIVRPPCPVIVRPP